MSLDVDALLKDWDYSTFFSIPGSIDTWDVVDRVERYVVNKHFDKHPFFDVARQSVDALYLWLAQELVMTNAFSQAVLYATSRIRNVHIRASLASVAYGEHGRVRNGIAKGAHPTLLDALRESAGLRPASVRPVQPTIDLIGLLCASLDDPICALAWIGIGNERLIFLSMKRFGNASKHFFQSRPSSRS